MILDITPVSDIDWDSQVNASTMFNLHLMAFVEAEDSAMCYLR